MPTRREFVQRSAAVGGAIATLGAVGASTACATGGAVERATSDAHVTRAPASPSAIKQSVCKWCFNEMTVDELAANSKRIGLKSVELVDPTDYADVTKPRPEAELTGLVYSLTEKPKDRDLPWIKRPTSLALIVIVLIVGLNLIFR